MVAAPLAPTQLVTSLTNMLLQAASMARLQHRQTSRRTVPVMFKPQIIEGDKSWLVFTGDHAKAGPFMLRREVEEAADSMPSKQNQYPKE